MADQEMSLIMRIRSVFDPGGAKEAAGAQADLASKSKAAGAATDASGKTLAATGQVAGRAAEQIGTVAASMGATSGAAGQAAAGVRLLSGALQTMNSAGGGLKGLLAAVVLLVASALVNWLIKVAGESKKLNEEAGKTNSVLTAMSKITLDAITSQQEKMRASASGTADQYERVLAAKNRMSSAQEQADLAQLDYEKAVDLSQAPKGDQFAARRIEAEYAAKAAAISQEAERTRQNNEVAIAESKVKELRGTAANADAEAGRISALKSNDQQRLEDMQRRASSPALKSEDREKLEKEIGELQLSIADLAKSIEAAQGKGAAARSQLPSAELDVLTSRTVRAGNDIRNRAQGMEGRNVMSDISYDQSQAAEDARRKIRDGEEAMRDRKNRDSELQSTFNEENNDLRKIDNGGKGDRDKEKRERDAALKALQEFRHDSTSFYSDLRSELEKLRESVRNNPAQAS